jgi:hypothetical protein
MANINKATNTEEYVDLYVEKGYANDDPNEFISLNGVNYILPRGKTSKVPLSVKKQYEKSLRARARQDENNDKLLDKAKQPIEM